MRDNARQLRDLRAAILTGAHGARRRGARARCRSSCAASAAAAGKQVRLVLDAGRAELDKARRRADFPGDRPPRPQRGRSRASSRRTSARAPASRRRARSRLALLARSNTRARALASATTAAASIARRVAARAVARSLRTDAALLDAARAARALDARRGDDDQRPRHRHGHRPAHRRRPARRRALADARRRGVGTTFTLRVPLTLSIVDAFTFECGAQRSSCRCPIVEEIVEVDRDARSPWRRRLERRRARLQR